MTMTAFIGKKMSFGTKVGTCNPKLQLGFYVCGCLEIIIGKCPKKEGNGRKSLSCYLTLDAHQND
jgi:hypothetical protein